MSRDLVIAKTVEAGHLAVKLDQCLARAERNRDVDAVVDSGPGASLLADQPEN